MQLRDPMATHARLREDSDSSEQVLMNEKRADSPLPKRSPVKAVQSILIRNEGAAVAGSDFLARVADQVRVAGGAPSR